MVTYNYSKGIYKDDRAKLFQKGKIIQKKPMAANFTLGRSEIIRKIYLLGKEFSTGADYPGRLEILLGGFQG